ncbi:DUF1428 domain-containing protein [Flagellimonas meridianipacifica]|uniref:Uncharacterized protein YbaA (DUF1428 family) n=1 Tax=Flagellimonas meridianipacifica TaxID=1080225 RepID=A0A2T0MAS5_9FLAO|nr:DUF1428 domain-containing protein [Allomuricauda pacifica]PRX54589.1 uncharacterized protein YbaA (DUF1428 family) [Allomuricauda pacifica]
MSNYIDGFVFPLPQIYVEEYKQVAEKVAEIWKEYGAIDYFEFVGDDMVLEGVKSFMETMGSNPGEVIVFGWVVFPSKEIRDLANEKVPMDPRMTELVAPLINPDRLIFDASRMAYGGFRPIVQTKID